MRTILPVILTVIGNVTSAQTARTELATVNELFADLVEVRIDRKQQLVFDVFDASGRFRQDIVPVDHLDAQNIRFSPEEDTVVLGCKTAHNACFTKEIFKLNTVRTSGRSNLPRPSQDVGGTATMDALKALIVAAQQQLASATETPERLYRKN